MTREPRELQKSPEEKETEAIKARTSLIFGSHWNGEEKIPKGASVWAPDVVKKVEEIMPTTIIPDGYPANGAPQTT